MQNFDAFFRHCTSHNPLPYQSKLAQKPLEDTILHVGTGLGKTQAVLVDYLYRRHVDPKQTPLRLIISTPMRTLTEQVAKVCRELVDRAALEIPVVPLMGGEPELRDFLPPDRPLIIIGTQDILLSRALNRGYASKVFRWPIDFALLNNDCWWVYDEVQLMQNGLATSTQLAAFRPLFDTSGPAISYWLSATLSPEWLDTIDYRQRPKPAIVELTEDDIRHEHVQRLTNASKKLVLAPPQCYTPKGLANFALEKHAPNSFTLIVVNTVSRARDTWRALNKLNANETLLLHSRFRSAEREQNLIRLSEIEKQGGIVVATQVVEAGLDLNAKTLVTDAAPYSSLVQRFGRCNRDGRIENASIFLVTRCFSDQHRKHAETPDAPASLKLSASPYDADEVLLALDVLASTDSAAQRDLPKVPQVAPWSTVLRRSDLLDLFDTTPDLGGHDLDISRFVRGGHDNDVFFGWKDWLEQPPPLRLTAADLCPVPIAEAKTFMAKHAVWTWSSSAIIPDEKGRRMGRWQKLNPKRDVDKLYPGMILLVHSQSGGYSPQAGWDPAIKSMVPSLPIDADDLNEAAGDDNLTYIGTQSLADHSQDVYNELRAMLLRLAELPSPDKEALLKAAELHDWGKAHPIFQTTLGGDPTNVLGKQSRNNSRRGHERPNFRHELASALAMLARNETDLACYLAAAHHGRNRVGIRSRPKERPSAPEKRIAAGVEDGDVLYACTLANGRQLPPTILSLNVMELGRDPQGANSWTERALRLLERYGPFRLAYLEMLLRVADMRASSQRESLNAHS
jgi:CRISPR-associated endonuclease/helicase Cas3